jgi:hypothetical protein
LVRQTDDNPRESGESCGVALAFDDLSRSPVAANRSKCTSMNQNELPNGSPPDSAPAFVNLRDIIERGIGERTHGRVRGLRVETTADRLIIRGCVNSCHIKQLALDAVIEVSDSFAIELDIRVERPLRRELLHDDLD